MLGKQQLAFHLVIFNFLKISCMYIIKYLIYALYSRPTFPYPSQHSVLLNSYRFSDNTHQLVLPMWSHSLGHGKPPGSHILNKEWFLFPQKVSTAKNSAVWNWVWRPCTPSMPGFWLVFKLRTKILPLLSLKSAIEQNWTHFSWLTIPPGTCQFP